MEVRPISFGLPVMKFVWRRDGPDLVNRGFLHPPLLCRHAFFYRDRLGCPTASTTGIRCTCLTFTSSSHFSCCQMVDHHTGLNRLDEEREEGEEEKSEKEKNEKSKRQFRAQGVERLREEEEEEERGPVG
eukprot:768245-Hanusia_phi.AAC.1